MKNDPILISLTTLIPWRSCWEESDCPPEIFSHNINRESERGKGRE